MVIVAEQAGVARPVLVVARGTGRALVGREATRHQSPFRPGNLQDVAAGAVRWIAQHLGVGVMIEATEAGAAGSTTQRVPVGGALGLIRGVAALAGSPQGTSLLGEQLGGELTSLFRAQLVLGVRGRVFGTERLDQGAEDRVGVPRRGVAQRPGLAVDAPTRGQLRSGPVWGFAVRDRASAAVFGEAGQPAGAPRRGGEAGVSAGSSQ